MYNYSKLLYNEDNSLILENKYLDRFYFTNNVAESIHHKLNLCLQKRKTTCLDFIESVRNCFTNDETKIGAIERYDIKSRTLISITVFLVVIVAPNVPNFSFCDNGNKKVRQ